MIFLSAQPAETYFLWQLEIQLKNFSDLGITANQFHILFGYDEALGLSPLVTDFISANRDFASFYAYPDTRSSKSYLSSIRPNIIKQHFFKYPELSREPIFYHDADIVFTNKLPDFDKLITDSTWYVSDTRTYLDSTYIKRFGHHIFNEMCEIIGIDKKIVEDNDGNAGGAQYIIKDTDFYFWNKVEDDCEKLFSHLTESKERYKKIFEEDENNKTNQFEEIQAWCTDMWVLFWNGLLLEKNVRISEDLNFCWPYFPRNYWESMYIFHNSGLLEKDAENYFYKVTYRDKLPYDDDFSHVDPKSCSSMYVSMLEQIAKKKYDLTDTTFTLSVRIDTTERFENLIAILFYIYNRFNTKVLLLEADNEPKIPIDALPSNVEYHFVLDKTELFHREKYNNQLARLVETDILIRYDADVIIPASQLKNAQISLKYRESDLCYPFNSPFMNVIGAYRKHFIRSLDVKVLSKYVGRFEKYGYPAYGGAFAIRKDVFMEIGMENERINGWGFEDQEIYKRAKILGYKIKRQSGYLYHLAHPRGINSYFSDRNEHLNSLREYLTTCGMEKDALHARAQSL